MGVKPAIIEENGVFYFPIGVVAKMADKSVQMIRLWDSWSDQLEDEGKPRLIPESHRIGKNRVRCWTTQEINEIISFSKNIKYGDIAQFSRTRWGEKANEMKSDKSTQARKEKNDYRKQVDTNSKKLQNQKRVEQIKQARGNMLKTVKRRARRTIEDSHKD